jgi:uncharacterized protein (TIGR02246 family)
MRLLTIVLFAVMAPAAAGAQAPGHASDESAIRDVVRRYVEARERADEAGVRALFTADADQLTSSGEWRKGRDSVVKGSMASSQTNAGTRTITIEAVRFPVPGVAIADGAYTIAGGTGAAARNMRTSFVLVSQSGAWRITAIRNMLPAPAQ